MRADAARAEGFAFKVSDIGRLSFSRFAHRDVIGMSVLTGSHISWCRLDIVAARAPYRLLPMSASSGFADFRLKKPEQRHDIGRWQRAGGSGG